MTAVLPARPQEAPPAMVTRRPEPMRPPVNTGDLWKWVDRLTLDRKEKLHRRFPGQRKSTIEHVPVPSLWTQMVEAIASTNSGGGHGKSATGSRSPMDLALAALMFEIERDILIGLDQLGAQARVQVNVDALRFRHDTKSDLRQLATLVAGSGDQVVVGSWVRRYRFWVARVEEALKLEPEAVRTDECRGTPCPCCLALWVTTEKDGEHRRAPALIAQFRDGQLQHLLCRACGADWRDDVDELTQWIAENEAEFGPAREWGQTVPKAEGA